MTEYVWDRETALRRVRNKADRLARLINIFLEGMPERFAKMAEAVTSDDLENCAHFAHAIKGVAANLGADVLQRLSSQAEQAAIENRMDEVKNLWPDMQSAHEDLLKELHAFLQSMEND